MNINKDLLNGIYMARLRGKNLHETSYSSQASKQASKGTYHMGETISKPFINLHIPKTAGTSMRAALIDDFGADRVAFMMFERQAVRASELPFGVEEMDIERRAARDAGQLATFSARMSEANRTIDYDAFSLSEIRSRDVDVATGHFNHKDITQDIMDVPLVTILRDPLERAWSHFSQWREAKGSIWWHSSDVIYSDDVSFEEFVTDQKLVNYQSQWLGELSISVTGVTTNLSEFLEQVGVRPDTRIPLLNPGMHRGVPSLSNPSST